MSKKKGKGSKGKGKGGGKKGGGKNKAFNLAAKELENALAGILSADEDHNVEPVSTHFINMPIFNLVCIAFLNC